jgi:hypothetical protein
MVAETGLNWQDDAKLVPAHVRSQRLVMFKSPASVLLVSLCFHPSLLRAQTTNASITDASLGPGITEPGGVFAMKGKSPPAPTRPRL